MFKATQSVRWQSMWFMRSTYYGNWPTLFCIMDDFGYLVAIDKEQFRISTAQSLHIL